MTCTTCGGVDYRIIAPGYLECTSDVADDVFAQEPDFNLPLGGGAYGMRTVRHRRSRPCGRRYQVAVAHSASLACGCGMFAVGLCRRCGRAVCGEHARTGESLLCRSCDEAERPEREARAAAAVRARKIDPVQAYVDPGDDFTFKGFLNHLHRAIEYRVDYSAEDCRRMAALTRTALTRDADGYAAWHRFVADRRRWAEESEQRYETARRRAARQKRRLDALPHSGHALNADAQLQRAAEATDEARRTRSVVERIQAHVDPTDARDPLPSSVAAHRTATPRPTFERDILAPAVQALHTASIPYTVCVMGGDLKVRKRWLGGWETSYTRGVIAQGWRFDDELEWGVSGQMETPVFASASGYLLTPKAELLQYDLTTYNGGFSGDYQAGERLLPLWVRPKGRPGLGPAHGLDEEEVRSDIADSVAGLLRVHGLTAD
jgi:hypothetical protein